VTNLGDTDTGSGNKGDLRYCIAQANANPGPDVIHFAPWVRGTITLDKTLGELDITDDLKILGPGADQLAVSGGNEVRVFYISPHTTATIARLEITLGRAAEAPETVVLRSHGGGVLNDTDANLTLTDVTLDRNTTKGFKDVGLGPNDESRHLGGAGGGGGANRGTLTVTGCKFIDNQALGFDGQVGAFAIPPDFSAVRFPGIAIGAGLWNWKTGTATVTNSQFIDNLAQAGSYCQGTFAGLGQAGAIYNDNDLTVTGSLFSGNRAVGGSHTFSNVFSGPAAGGAISSGTNERLLGDPESAVLKVSQCIFSHNQAHGGNESLAGPQGVAVGAGTAIGGGILVFQGEATISRSVLDHNQAIGGEGAPGRVGGLAIGGGILFINFLPGVTGAGVTGAVEGCALVGNESSGGTGVAGGRGGNAQGGGLAAGAFGTSALSGTVTVSNTLVTGNVAQGGAGGLGGAGGNGQGGGVFNDAGSKMDVTASLIIFNSALGGAGQGGGLDGQGKGGGVYNQGTFTDVLTVIALNRASTSDPDCVGC
jgi:hypothetical protein